jgi:hypothetical protein
MKIRSTFIPSLAMALALSSGVSLMGQAVNPGDFDGSFKPRYGTTFGNIKTDTKMDQSLGLGIEGRYALTGSSWIVGELVYEYYPGKEYDNTQLTGPVYVPSGSSYVTGDANGAYVLKPASSVDSRKAYMAGMSARVGYEAMFSTEWSWQAGITVDFLKYTEEVSGALTPLTSSGTRIPLPSGYYYESLAVTPHKVSPGVGAFAGVKYMISHDFSLEFNAVSMGYSTQYYNPTTYSGEAPSVSKESRHGFGLEVAFGLKL